MTKIEKFTHDGREFEIRAAALNQKIEAQSFYKGKRIATYTVTYETASDMQHHGWGNAVDQLIAYAKADIEHYQLPKLKAALEAVQP